MKQKGFAMREGTPLDVLRLFRRTPAQPRHRRSLSGRVLPDGHEPLPMWEELVRPGSKGDPAKRARREQAKRRGVPCCRGKNCRKLPGHDDGVHEPPRRRVAVVRRHRWFVPTRSPRAAHAVDPSPRRSKVERQLVDPRVRRALRERAAERRRSG